MKINIAILGLIIVILTACSGSPLDSSRYQDNMAKLDKLYGPCNNPQRILLPADKKKCEAAARAAGPDGKIKEPIDILDIFNKNQSTVIATSTVNKFLWDASLKTLNAYTIKSVDFEGGFIQTDWIYDETIPNQRCLIKSHITSPELVSTGLNIKIICENFKDEIWYVSNESFAEEEKQLTLKILEESNSLSKL